jgi:SAM-dependent methyltransferase
MLIKEKIGNLSGMRILEIGCATGDLLLWLNREGSYTHGLEISEYASEVARKRGLEITTGTIESFGQDVRCLFDLIIAFEVIEHVPSPVIFLEKVAEHIRPGGHLMLSTPNYSCAKRYGNQWYGFTESFEHIYFFSRDILERIAGQAGLILTYWESSMFSGDTSRMPGFLDRHIDRCARLALMSQEIGFPKALRLAWKRTLNYLPYGNGHKLLVVFQKEPVTDR